MSAAPPITIHEVSRRDLVAWRPSIVAALGKINARSGNRYGPEEVFYHLGMRLAQQPMDTALWLLLDRQELEAGAGFNAAVCGLVTLDLAGDELGRNVAMISRAWTRPGIGRVIWRLVEPQIWKWAKDRHCVRVQFQSERDTAFARWMKADGFVTKETLFEKEID